MINTITANEIKTKGVSVFKKATSNNNEAFISVRGKNKYVVMSIEEYNHLRECELEVALLESRQDLEKGKFFSESVDKHLERIKNG